MSERLEDLLPREMRFATVLEEVGPLVEEQIELLIDTYRDCLDLELEFSRDAPHLWVTSAMLGKVLASEDEPETEITPVVYRAMAFALQVAQQLKSQPLGNIPVASHLLDGHKSLAEMRDKIITDGSHYLSNREALDVLIGLFVSDIDPSGRYLHHAETSMALVFMLCERDQAERYYRGVIARLAMSDFEMPSQENWYNTAGQSSPKDHPEIRGRDARRTLHR